MQLFDIQPLIALLATTLSIYLRYRLLSRTTDNVQATQLQTNGAVVAACLSILFLILCPLLPFLVRNPTHFKWQVLNYFAEHSSEHNEHCEFGH